MRTLRLLSIIPLCLALNGCATMVLEEREIANKRVEPLHLADGTDYVEISGFAAREGYGVTIIQTERAGGDVFMKVKLGDLSEGFQPYFRKQIRLLSGSERIFFGRGKEMIWPKPAEVTETTSANVTETEVDLKGTAK